MIIALAGGVGGAKLAAGLVLVLPPEELIIGVNTGDDFEHLGLHISPDLDTVMYTLAGIADRQAGWGQAGETWSFMRALERLGGPTWFKLGDRDLATHAERTRRLRAGESLSDATRALCERLGVRHTVVPMSDDPVRTIVHTERGALEFQHYFVREQCEPRAMRFEYRGCETARPSRALLEAFNRRDLGGVIFCPSNPHLSIAPILAVPGMREAIENCGRAVAVSPIIAGRAVKGPAAKIMRELGIEPSSVEVARFFRGLARALVIDRADAALSAQIEALGIEAVAADTLMQVDADRERLARVCTALLCKLGA